MLLPGRKMCFIQFQLEKSKILKNSIAAKPMITFAKISITTDILRVVEIKSYYLFYISCLNVLILNLCTI